MKRLISVIGLGYVGLPVAAGFGRVGYQVVASTSITGVSPNFPAATTARARSSRLCSRRRACVTRQIPMILRPPTSTS
jgi:3-hydroxyisobutyrate dehydrogenase-like beta-hydroxyacid dehydrogenase